MSVQTSYAPVTYNGDGVTSAFTIPWAYQFAADIVAVQTVVATGVNTTLVLGTNYTINPSLNNETAQTGTCALTVALPVGSTLTLSRAPAPDQTSIWVENFSNPAKLYENAVDKLTLIVQGINYALSQIGSGGGSGGLNCITTADYVVAAVNASQIITVSSASGINVNNFLLISDGFHTSVVQVTAISILNLTCTTLSIPKGSPTGGDTMKKGAAVTLSSVPSNNTIVISDAANSSGAVSTIALGGSIAGELSNSYGHVSLYMNGSGTNLIQGYVDQQFTYSVLYNGNRNFFGTVLGIQPGGVGTHGPVVAIQDTVGNLLLQTDGGTNVLFDTLKAVHVPNGLLTPPMMSATNSPSAGQVPSYTNAGQYTWVTPSGSSLPPSGNAGVFLRGDAGGTWSSFLNTTLGSGAFLLGTSEATNAYAAFLSNDVSTPSGFNQNLHFGIVKKGASTWANAGTGAYIFDGAIAASLSAATAAYSPIDASNVEVAQFMGVAVPAGGFLTNIVRAHAFRSGAGYWQYAFTLNNPGAAVTVDLKNGSYQRHTGIANNVTITLADSTVAPNAANWQFANELTLEINAPGAFIYTWPGTVTWANGASLPTLSAAGINVIKLVRRQGQTQWIGSVVNSAGSGGTYTDAQARAAVITTSQLLASSAIGWSIVAGVSATPSINALSITNSMLAAGISPSKLVGFPGTNTVFLDGSGAWSTPSGAGFSTAVNHAWTGIQNFNVEQVFAAQTSGTGSGVWGSSGSTSTVYLNGCTEAPSSLPGDTVADAAGLYIRVSDNYATPAGHGGISALVTAQTVTAAKPGFSGIDHRMTSQASVTAGTFGIHFVQIHEAKKIAGGGVMDALWHNLWGPDSNFSASPDASGVVHTFTSGFARIGEINYGNAWADFGRIEDRASATRLVCGIEYIPDWLAGSTGDANPTKFPVQWAISIIPSGAAPNGSFGKHWTGIFFGQDAVMGGTGTYGTGGYGINLRGVVTQTNPAAIALKVQDKWDSALDTTSGTFSTTGAGTNVPAGGAPIVMATNQAIRLGANTFLYFDGTHIKAVLNGAAAVTVV